MRAHSNAVHSGIARETHGKANESTSGVRAALSMRTAPAKRAMLDSLRIVLKWLDTFCPVQSVLNYLVVKRENKRHITDLLGILAV